MRLNLKAITLTAGIIWALAVFLTGIANMVWVGYGDAFLKIMASIYPGYDAGGAFGDVIIGTLYAFADGAVCGLIFGWLYNLFAGKS